MNAHSLIFGALLATSASAAEPVIFHTSRFSDMTVEMSLVSSQFSKAIGYDFDVTIGMVEIRQDGRPAFRDRRAHMALVRCGAPATISVGGADYPIGRVERPLEPDNWKLDLWRAVCVVPTS